MTGHAALARANFEAGCNCAPFDKSRILTEYLYHWPNGREALIFSRENNGYQFRENIQEQFTLAGRTAENRLYLSSSIEWNCPQTEKAYLCDRSAGAQPEGLHVMFSRHHENVNVNKIMV